MNGRFVRAVAAGFITSCALLVALRPTPIEASVTDAIGVVGDAAAPALSVSGAAQEMAAALGASRGIAGPLSLLATAEAGRRANHAIAGLGTPGPLAEEILAFYDAAGLDVAPGDVTRLELDAAALPAADAERLAALVRAIRVAATMVDEALAGLSDDERTRLESLLTEAGDALADDHVDSDERGRKLLELDALASRVDIDGIFAASLVTASALDSTLRPLAKAACGLPASLGLAPFSDPTGTIVVGSIGNDTYTSPTVILIEPGGDDAYELGNRAGGVLPGGFPISILVDVDGDDAYHSGGTTDVNLTYVEGAAGLGVGVLVDVCGDDEYASTHVIAGPASPSGPPVSVSYDLFRSQGHGALGVGVLVDAEGNDDYASENRLEALAGFASYHTAYVQGSGHFGIGLLIDALGTDRYSSANVVRAESGTTIANAVGDPVATFSTEFCQGAGLSLGAGALLEGTDYDLIDVPDPDPNRPRPPRVFPFSGSDAYNSNNDISAASDAIGGHGGQTNVYSLICQGVSGAPYPTAKPGRPGEGGNGQSAPPPPEGYGIAAGILVDATGDDLYNSRNRLLSSGTDSGSLTAGKCRTCHVPAVFNVRVNQGASGAAAPPPDWRELFGPPYPEYTPPNQPPAAPPPAGQGVIGVAHLGVMIDGIGSDLYNSANDIRADGYDTSVNNSPICAHAEYQVLRSEGFGGNEDLVEAITGEACSSGGIGDHGCKDPAGGTGDCPPSLGRACVGPGRVLGKDLPGAGLPILVQIPVLPGCFAGVLVDGQGDDGYNSDNVLEAKDSDSVFTKYIVDVSLGSGLGQGVGVAVDGVASDDGSVKPSCGGTACPSIPGLPRPVRTTNDTYNSRNDASVMRSPTGTGTEYELWSITRSLGSGSNGYGVLASLGPLGIGSFTLPGGSGGSFPSTDVYNSDNGCVPYYLHDSSSFGFARGGAGAFVDAFGDDRYEQNPCPTLSLDSYGYAANSLALGVPPSLPDIGVFADLWGDDTYPSPTYPAPVSMLGTPAPPDDDGIWTPGPPAAGIGLGIDLLPYPLPLP